MYKIKRASKVDKIEKHLNVEPNIDVDSFGSYEYDPLDLRKCFLSRGIERIPEEKLKELNETGKTIFTFTETTTIYLERSINN